MKNEFRKVRNEKKRHASRYSAAPCFCLYSFLTLLNSFLAPAEERGLKNECGK